METEYHRRQYEAIAVDQAAVPNRRLVALRARRRWIVLLLLCGLLIVTRLMMKSIALGQPMMPLPYAFVPSPNCDERPPGSAVNCIVLHATVEPSTAGTERIFLTPSRAVSAHFVVGKDGRVVQMVPVERRAWHAGTSVLEGVPSVNDFSVGIEMVNLNDGRDPYPDAQMQAVAGIIRFLRSRYDIPDSRIVSHAQIAQPQGRKTDPAGFDFDRIRRMAKEGLPEEIPPMDR
jgi:N-acetylmuramoyl-L-alanine amidase